MSYHLDWQGLYSRVSSQLVHLCAILLLGSEDAPVRPFALSRGYVERRLVEVVKDTLALFMRGEAVQDPRG
jgi:hypothetical protein